MKIFYFNDDKVDVTVRVIDVKGNNTLTTLSPLKAQTFEFDAPEGAVPYVKRWSNNIVLLSYITVPVSSMDT